MLTVETDKSRGTGPSHDEPSTSKTISAKPEHHSGQGTSKDSPFTNKPLMQYSSTGKDLCYNGNKVLDLNDAQELNNLLERYLPNQASDENKL